MANYLRTTRMIFSMNALIWLALGVFSLFRKPNTISKNLHLTLVLLMFANCGVLLVCGLLLGTTRLLGRPVLAWGLALAVLALNILLTFTDQIGPPDLITLLLDLILFVLLLWKRTTFTHTHPKNT